jgi:hypothetical protein
VGQTAAGSGIIQALTNGSTFNNLLLNPRGGSVLIGTGTVPIANSVLTIQEGGSIPVVTLTNGSLYARIGRAQNFFGSGSATDLGISAPLGTNLLLGVSGTEGMRITSTGNIGIGTTTPTAKLDIFNTTSSATAPLFSVASSTTGAGTSTALFIDANGNVGVGTTSPWATFAINPVAGVAPNQFIVGSSTKTSFLINNSGNVAIAPNGISTPNSYLAVNGTGLIGSANINSYDIGAGRIAVGSALYSYGSICVSNSQGTCTGTNGVVLGVLNTTAYTNITTSGNSFFGGNLGIGTTTPTAKLDIFNTTSSATAPLFSIASSTSGAATSTAFYVTANGLVGVGTSSPFATLAVNPVAGAASNQFVVGSSSATNFIINNTGNVGIGSTTPYAKLSVVGPVVAEYFNATSTSATSTFTGAVFNGNVGIGTAITTSPLTVSKTYTDTAGTPFLSTFTSTLAPTADSSANNAALTGSISTSGGFNFTNSVRALNFYANNSGTGIVTEMRGVSVYVSQNSTGTTTNAFNYFSQPTSYGTGTTTNAYGFAAYTPYVVAGSFTNAVGFASQNQNTGTNNTNLLLGTLTVPTGNYSIYNSSAYNNYFAGNVGIGTTSPYASLSITNTGTNPSFVVEDSASPDTTPFIIDASGNVGIGTTSPSTKLQIAQSGVRYVSLFDVQSTQSNIFRMDDNSAVNVFTLENRDITATTDQGLDIDYRLANDTTTGAINAGTIRLAKENAWTTTASTNDSYFAFSPATDAVTTERMRIVGSTGFVGIGTSTPSSKLEIYQGSITLDNNQALNLRSLSGTSVAAIKYDSGDNLILNTPSSGDVYVRSNGSTVGRFTSAGQINLGGTNATAAPLFTVLATGNAGIGTTSPFAKLDIFNTTSSATAPLFSIASSTSGAGTSTALYITSNGRVGVGTTSPLATFAINPVAGAATYQLVVGSSTGTNFQINNSGNVSIGTSTNVSKLDIRPVTFNSSQADGITLGNTTNNGWNSTIFLRSDVNGVARLSIGGPGGAVPDSLVIVSSGNIGIGTTTPSSKLNIYSSTNGDVLKLEGTANGTATGLKFTNQSGDMAAIRSAYINSAVSTETYLSLHTNPSGGNGQLSTEVMRLTGAGNVGIGTTTPTAKFDIFNTTSSVSTPLFSVASSTSGAGTSTAFYINSNGIVGIGTTSPTSPLHVYGSAAIPVTLERSVTTANIGIEFKDQTSSWYAGKGSGGDFNLNTSANLNSSAKLALTTGGALTVSSCTGCSSDERLKKNIEPLSSDAILDQILKLRPVSFNWRGAVFGVEMASTTQYGFIAQEAQKVFPDLVIKDVATEYTPGGTYLFNYQGLISPLVVAVQRLYTMITETKEHFTTKTLCVEDVCVTRDQFLAMVNAAAGKPTATTTYATDFGAPLKEVTLPLAPSASSTMVLDGPVVTVTTTATTTPEIVASTTPIMIELPVATTTATTTNETQP